MKSNRANLLGAMGLLTTLVVGCYSSTTATIKDDCPRGQAKALDGSGTCVDLSKEIAERSRSKKKKPDSHANPTCPPGEKYYPTTGKCSLDYASGF